jgi:hypothetical protein
MTGYGFLFYSGRNLEAAKTLVARMSSPAPVVIDYDPSDAVAESLAERIAVDASQSGLRVRAIPRGSALPDAQLVRLPMPANDPAIALVTLAEAAGMGDIAAVADLTSELPDSLDRYDRLYSAERGLLADFRLIPLFHLPEVYGLNRRVQAWNEPRDGGWPVADVWLSPK